MHFWNNLCIFVSTWYYPDNWHITRWRDTWFVWSYTLCYVLESVSTSHSFIYYLCNYIIKFTFFVDDLWIGPVKSIGFTLVICHFSEKMLFIFPVFNGFMTFQNLVNFPWKFFAWNNFLLTRAPAAAWLISVTRAWHGRWCTDFSIRHPLRHSLVQYWPTVDFIF